MSKSKVTLSSEQKDKVISWSLSSKVGLSSAFIVKYLMGIDCREVNYPYDPSDLNRCLNLLDTVPELKESFLAHMGDASPEWNGLMKNWELLEKTLVREKATKDSAPETYNLMKDILATARKNPA